MPKKYKYVNGNKMIVVNNYDLGTDVIPEEEQIVPDPLVTDVGKVLTVNQAGNPAWEDAPEELPALTGNAGKVLTVSSGASGVEWAEVPEELPAVTSADAGDVLTVNASGEWEAAAPGGGGGGLTLYGPFVFYVDELNPVSVLAGGTENVPLPSIKDYNGHTFTLSGLSSDAVFVLQSFGTAGNGLLCAKIVEPYYFNASWSAPSGLVTNTSDIQQSIQSDSDFFVQFMCTEQLSEAT